MITLSLAIILVVLLMIQHYMPKSKRPDNHFCQVCCRDHIGGRT